MKKVVVLTLLIALIAGAWAISTAIRTPNRALVRERQLIFQDRESLLYYLHERGTFEEQVQEFLRKYKEETAL